ncbi:MAG: hypothetical protein C0392_04095 [Syntrophus sp. (in: bacteria)]|nr:hypothetical protein [Syntrophus sp. (in: bacteria)]
MDAFGITDRGKKRENNQDSIYPSEQEFKEMHRPDRSLMFYVVADGMGGHVFGEVASRKAVTIINDFVKESILNSNDESLREDEFIIGILKEAVQNAHRDIYEYSQSLPEKETMGTTVSAVLFRNGKAYIAHAGDSRIYRLRKGNLEKLTKDHTEIQRLVDMGAIGEEEAENHGLSHILTMALGAIEHVEPDFIVCDIQEGDSFLLTSDGLFRVLNKVEVTEVMMKRLSAQEKCEALVNSALEGGAPDNVSVIVVETGKRHFLKYICPRLIVAGICILSACLLFFIFMN